jgi:hypothetical protein
MTATVQRITLQASSAQTATNNGTAYTGVGNRREMIVFLNVTAVSGTTPSMTVKMQTSDDGGTTWYDIPGGAFTAATAATTQLLSFTAFGDTVRCVSTISGTTPSFTYAVKAVCK